MEGSNLSPPMCPPLRLMQVASPGSAAGASQLLDGWLSPSDAFLGQHLRAKSTPHCRQAVFFSSQKSTCFLNIEESCFCLFVFFITSYCFWVPRYLESDDELTCLYLSKCFPRPSSRTFLAFGLSWSKDLKPLLYMQCPWDLN